MQIYDLSRVLIAASDLNEIFDATLKALEDPPTDARGYLVIVQPDGSFYHSRQIGLPPEPHIDLQTWRASLTGAALVDDEQPQLLVPTTEIGAADWELALSGPERRPLAVIGIRRNQKPIGAIVRTLTAAEGKEELTQLSAIAELFGIALARIYHQAGLMQNAKVASIGRLTAAIAHEINNPLQAIANALYLVTHQEFGEEQRVHYLSRAQREVEHMAALVRRMLDFYQPNQERMRPLRIHALLEQTIAIVTPQAHQNHIVIERQWAEESLWVNGVAGHLKQVFLSLFLTMLDAMPDGGTLEIRTLVQSNWSIQGQPLAVIEISGSITGLSANMIGNLFDPSFRARSNGSGLGLPISYTIVEQHGGTISARLQNQAAIFQVTLPAMRA